MGNSVSTTTAKPYSLPSVDPAELYETLPPEFGPDARALFAFESGYVNLNHGSFGSLPRPVRYFCDRLTDEVESNPDKFMRINRVTYVNRVRERIAKIIGAEADEVVFVPNTSHGIATVLYNFPLNEGDVLLGATTTYTAVSKLMQYLAEIHPHITLSSFDFQFPTKRGKIIQDFEEYIKQMTSAVGPTRKRRIIAIIDSITSRPGLCLPWKEMVAICRAAGVVSVVDGAHTLGQQVDLNLSKAQPDFFIADCHKGFYSKRACALLYVPKRNQYLIKSSIPTPRNYRPPPDPPQKFLDLFDWTGTIDFVPQLSVGAAIDFREWLGGEHRISKYIHALAIAGGKRLAKRFCTSVMDPDGDLTVNFVCVELPLSGDIQDTGEVQNIFVETLIVKWRTYSGSFRYNGRWWVRVTAQIWNQISDFDVLGNALVEACQNVTNYAAQRNS